MDLLYKDKRVPIPIIYMSVTAVNERKLATETATPLRSYITVYYLILQVDKDEWIKKNRLFSLFLHVLNSENIDKGARGRTTRCCSHSYRWLGGTCTASRAHNGQRSLHTAWAGNLLRELEVTILI